MTELDLASASASDFYKFLESAQYESYRVNKLAAPHIKRETWETYFGAENVAKWDAALAKEAK